MLFQLSYKLSLTLQCFCEFVLKDIDMLPKFYILIGEFGILKRDLLLTILSDVLFNALKIVPGFSESLLTLHCLRLQF